MAVGPAGGGVGWRGGQSGCCWQDPGMQVGRTFQNPQKLYQNRSFLGRLFNSGFEIIEHSCYTFYWLVVKEVKRFTPMHSSNSKKRSGLCGEVQLSEMVSSVFKAGLRGCKKLKWNKWVRFLFLSSLPLFTTKNQTDTHTHKDADRAHDRIIQASPNEIRRSVNVLHSEAEHQFCR